MDICHPHNLNRNLATESRFGIRVRMKPTDTLHRLIGGQLEKVHWFRTRIERDRALADMRNEHLYSRRGDKPTLELEAIERR